MNDSADTTAQQPWATMCRDHGDRLTWSFSDGDSVLETLTGSEAARWATALAGWLQERTSPGDRVLIGLPYGSTFIAALLAAEYAGLVAVPLSPEMLDHSEALSPAAAYIVSDAEPTVVLTSSAYVSRFQGMAEHIVDAAALPRQDDAQETPPREAGWDEVAILLYTSGSTGAPKGVQHTRCSILSEMRVCTSLWQVDEGSSVVSWLPLSHSFGMSVGFLGPLLAGCPVLLMPSAAFIEAPDRWLRLLATRHATHTAAPNFALDHAIRHGAAQLDDDVSLASVRTVLTAGECVRRDTVEQFHATFAPWGLRRDVLSVHYGSTEMCSVTCSRLEAPVEFISLDRASLRRGCAEFREPGAEGARDVPSCGAPRGHVRLEVRDAQGHDLGEDRVGELHVLSGSASSGYWRNPELTGRQFTSSEEGRWYRTGDLAVIHDQQLFIVGRESDVIIINAVNYDPADLELSLREGADLPQGLETCVISCDIDDRERVVVVQEIPDRMGKRQRAGLRERSVIALSQSHGLSVHEVVLVPPGTLRGDGIGKLSRKAVARRYLEGELGGDRARGVSSGAESHVQASSFTWPQDLGLVQERWVVDTGRRSPRLGDVLLVGAEPETVPAWREACAPFAGRVIDASDDQADVVAREATSQHVSTVLDLRGTHGPWDAETMAASWRMLAALAQQAGDPPAVFLVSSAVTPQARAYCEALVGFERSVGRVVPDWQVHPVVIDEEVLAGSAWRSQVAAALDPAAGATMLSGEGLMTLAGERMSPDSAEPLPSPEGSWLVLGVTGGIGSSIARWLQQAGASIVGAGRRGLDDAGESLRAAGLEGIDYRGVDLGAPTDLSALVASVAAERSLQGVVWAAGPGPLPSMPEADPREVDMSLRLRLDSAAALARAAAEAGATHILWCSSTAAHLGDFGSCEYAVGNRYLAALAANGLGTSIAWPLWAEIGVGQEDTDKSSFMLAATGQSPLPPHEAVGVLGQVAGSSGRSMAVVKGDVDRVLAALPSPRQGSGVARKTSGNGPASPEEGSRQRGVGEIERALADMLHELLRLPVAEVALDVSMHDMGLDSISLVELSGMITEQLGATVAPDVFFSHPTVNALAEHLVQHVVRSGPGTDESPGGPVAAPALRRRSTGRAAGAPLPPVTSAPGADSDEAEPSPQQLGPEAPASSAPRSQQPSVDRRVVGAGVVVSGMAGVFPGAAGVDELWSLVREGRVALGPVPVERGPWWGRARGAVGGWLESVGRFDPLFFEIAPREAEVMDPRQRLLLQEMWHAMEDAGVGPSVVSGERVGVFVGAESGEFADVVGENDNVTSNHSAMLAGRLSYFLNLRGPALVVDTACSSGLVAFHQAVGSIERGECDVAVVASANVMTTGKGLNGLNRAGMVSGSGVCSAFGAGADGLVPGEAVVAVVVAREDVARRCGLGLVARVSGSGVNCDGRTNGISAPSGEAQKALLRQVWSRGGVDPGSLGLVVAHGTGTPLGDPVEVNALVDAFGGGPVGSCAVVSVKPNVGHSLAASGLVGLVVLACALRDGQVPPSACCEPLSSYVDWESSPVFVSRELGAWPGAGGLRRGGVSAFGFSGTNAHVVLEREVGWDEPVPAGGGQGPVVLMVSAKTETALVDSCRNLADWLEREGEDVRLDHLAVTLALHRFHFAHRAGIVARTRQEAVEGLEAVAQGRKTSSVVRGRVTQGHQPNEALDLTIRDLVTRATHPEDWEALARLFCAGCDPTLWWEPRTAPVPLPGYPFEEVECWPSVMTAGAQRPGAGALVGTLLSENLSSLSSVRYGVRGLIPTQVGHVVFAAADAARLALDAATPPVLSNVVWRDEDAADSSTMITCEPSAAAGTVWTLLNESAALVDGEAFLRTDRDEVASPQALEALESHGMSVHETTGADLAGSVDALLARAAQGWSLGGVRAVARAEVPADASQVRSVRVDRLTDGLLDIVLADSDGEPVGALRGIELEPAERPEAAGRTTADDAAVRSWLVEQLGAAVTEVLGVSRGEQERDRVLSAYGADSLNLSELSRDLTRRLGVQVAPDMFFSHPTLERLEAALVRRYGEQMRSLAPGDEPGRSAPVPRSPRQRAARRLDRRVVGAGVVVSGMAGVFPGAAGVDELWSLVREGRVALGPVPVERGPWWGRARGAVGGWLESVGRFDPLFFEIAPREAEVMDPRQRLLLQEMWHAMEDAGVGPSVVSGERVGVFVGAESGEFADVVGENDNVTSNHSAMLAGRLSYFLNLRGPALVVDTACSSGLVAFHQAVGSIERGECDVAVVASANVMTTGKGLNGLNRAGMVSGSGVCSAFGAGADGLVPGEAVVAVVVAREDVARRCGLGLVARVSGSGVNCDGRTNGISAPSGEAQKALLRQVWSRGGVDPGSLGLVVAHGTGTPLGDPVEVNALVDAFGGGPVGSCAVVSVKPNVGHSLAASGLVGLVVLACALRDGQVPPSACCEPLSSYVDWESSPVFVSRELGAWPGAGGLRRGGVSAFGFSGTNAHVVLEREVGWDEPVPAGGGQGPVVLMVSAKTETALVDSCRNLADWLEREGEDVRLDHLAVTLALHRFHFAHRAGIVIPPGSGAVGCLRRAAAGERSPDILRGVVPAQQRPNPVLAEAAQRLWDELRAQTRVPGADTVQAVAELYCRGYEPTRGAGDAPCLGGVPRYPFASDSYWPQPPAAREELPLGASDDVEVPDLRWIDVATNVSDKEIAR